MSRKRDRRIAEGAREHEEAVAALSASATIAAKDNSDLFTIDTAGASTRASKRQKTFAEVVETGTVSKTEQVLLKKALERSAEKKAKSVSQDNKGDNAGLSDLWNDDSWVPVTKSKKTAGKAADIKNKKDSSKNGAKKDTTIKTSRDTKKKFVSRVARPGQSYNPSVEDHQDAVTGALALEMQKAEKEAKLLALTNKYATDVVVATAAGEGNGSGANDNSASDEAGEDGDDNEDSGDDDEDVNGTKKSRKQREKMTKAQRNKQKARNIAKYEEEKIRLEKIKEKQANNVGTLLKEVRREEEEVKSIKEAKKAKKQETDEMNMYAMTYQEAGTIPLSDELSGSLRQIIPKGIPLVSMENEMRRQGDLSERDRRNRRAYEKPHASERVVWVPKYKVHEFDK